MINDMNNDDILDGEVVRRSKQMIKSGEMETFLSEFVDRLLFSDDHPLKIWREYRGLKAKELAEKVGVSPEYISKIENYKKDGSVALLVKISRILNVDIDDIIDRKHFDDLHDVA